jgi:hypothetical protein
MSVRKMLRKNKFSGLGIVAPWWNLSLARTRHWIQPLAPQNFFKIKINV